MTLRTRLTLLTFSVLLLTMLAFAGVAGAVLWRVELAAITRQVSAQADALLTVARQAPGPPEGAAELLETEGVTAVARVYQGAALRWSGGALGPDVLDPIFLTDQETRRTGEVAGYLTASRRAGEVTVQVGRSLTPLRGLLRRYALVAALTLLLLSLLAGALVAREVRRALRPLEALVSRVGHLDTPDPVPAVAERGEVGALARALDTSLRALRAERERETLFLASASHELRTPVTALLADLQYTLARERPPEELRAALRRTERTAARLRQLTGNLMTLTRAQRLPAAPGAEPRPSLDLLDLAGEAVDLLQPLASRRGTDLWLDGQPTPLRGDSALLGSVLENLIGNAIKFTPEGGRVQVRVTPLRGGAGRLVVEDNGPGFPPGTLTEAFVRGQADVEGFGLGLAVVREVVEAHGGSLTLSAAGDGGAHAEVVLPA